MQFNFTIYLACCVYSTREEKVVVRTPALTNRTASRLAIALELDDGRRVLTNRSFDYRDNPVLKDIEPRSHLTR